MSLTGIVFLGCFVVGMLLSFFRHPLFGLYTYLAVFYLDPAARWWGAELPDLRWSLVAALVTMVSAAKLPRTSEQRTSWIRTTPAVILILYTVWMWIQYLWAVNPEDHVTASVLFTKYVILFYLIYKLVQTPEQMRLFLAVHVSGCFYLGVLAYQMASGGRLEGVGGSGISEANSLAMHVGTAVMLGSMIMLSERRWAFWLCLAAMPFVLNTFVLAGSRGAFLAILCGSVTLWLTAPRVYRRAFVTLAGLALILFMILASDFFWERMGTIQHAATRTEQIDESAASRYAIFKMQWSITKDYPHGIGHRGLPILGQRYIDEEGRLVVPGGKGRDEVSSSHNTFMTALSEQGVPGALMYLAMLVYCIRTCRTLRKEWQQVPGPLGSYAAGLAGALTVVFVAGLFVDYIKAEVQIWLFALLASASHWSRMEKAARGTVAATRNSTLIHS